ncbi:MAG TPA: DUF2314 domain-containing protein [Longimicrobium sp.]|jgi:uncharacterized protein YegJ (DUF2314 family)
MRLIPTAARLFTFATLMVAGACGRVEQAGKPVREFDEEKRIVHTNEDDQVMNAAIARARATAPQLIERLNHTPPGLSYLGVKAGLHGPGGVREHIWLSNVSYADGKIAGKLTEDARMFPGFNAGDVVRVEPGEISDWMTVENGRACGGFTSRIVLAEVTSEVRAAYMAEMGIPRLPPGDAVCDDGRAGTPG